LTDNAKIAKRKGALIRYPLTTLSGLLNESARVYRAMRKGKLQHEEGRSLVWVLAQMRAMVETQIIETLEQRLAMLEGNVIQGNSRGLPAPNREIRPVH
jgi:hypothetical protein